MKLRRSHPVSRNSLFDRLEAALVTVAWSLLPCAIYWLVFNYHLGGTSWQLTGSGFLKILAVAGLLGFAFPRAIPAFVGTLWDGIMALGRYGPW